jgi:hypothetical protein
MKKNPLMSMWLSGANAVLGSARSRTTAQAKRQAPTIVSDGAKQVVRVWSGALIAAPRRKKRKSR